MHRVLCQYAKVSDFGENEFHVLSLSLISSCVLKYHCIVYLLDDCLKTGELRNLAQRLPHAACMSKEVDKDYTFYISTPRCALNYQCISGRDTKWISTRRSASRNGFANASLRFTRCVIFYLRRQTQQISTNVFGTNNESVSHNADLCQLGTLIIPFPSPLPLNVFRAEEH